eukprot:1212653-Pyramimonas_sp.AAC.1
MFRVCYSTVTSSEPLFWASPWFLGGPFETLWGRRGALLGRLGALFWPPWGPLTVLELSWGPPEAVQ